MSPSQPLRCFRRVIVLLGLSTALSATAVAPALAAEPRAFPRAPLPAVVPAIAPEPDPGWCPRWENVLTETGTVERQYSVRGKAADGCYFKDWAGAQQIFLDPGLDRFERRVTTGHELGHAFDYQHMSEADHGHFRFLVRSLTDGKQPWPWKGDDHSLEQMFADAYAMCHLHWSPGGFNWDTNYSYTPGRYVHGQVCRGIDKWRWTP